jgi:ferritin-like metal-binding protein YciE
MASAEENLMAWLRDAHAMETQAIQMLEGQAQRLENYPELRAKVQDHIEETRRQAEMVEECIDRRGGRTSGLKEMAAGFTGNMQAMSGILMSDEVMKGGIASYTFEHFEIANYRALIAAAEQVGDQQTRSTCEQILRQEEAMASWLSQHLPQVTRQYLERDATGGPAKR